MWLISERKSNEFMQIDLHKYDCLNFSIGARVLVEMCLTETFLQSSSAQPTQLRLNTELQQLN